MRHSTAPVATCLLALLVGGCSTGNAIKRQMSDVLRGPDYLYKADESLGEDQTRLAAWRVMIADRAGLTAETYKLPGNLGQYRLGGFTFVDGQCNTYLDALRRFNIEKRTVVSQLGITQTAVAGALGAASVAAQELALTAVGFGLAGSTVDTVSSGLLYELEPALVADIVQRAQAKYRQGVLTNKTLANLAEAEADIWGYAELCTPNQIEIFVKQSTQTSVAASSDGGRVSFGAVAASSAKPGQNEGQATDQDAGKAGATTPARQP